MHTEEDNNCQSPRQLTRLNDVRKIIGQRISIRRPKSLDPENQGHYEFPLLCRAVDEMATTFVMTDDMEKTADHMRR